MKEGSLFCSIEIHRTGMLQIVFLMSLESSQQGGVHGLVNEAGNALKRELLGALSESLGLQSSFLDDLCGEFQKSNSNYYPPCPEPQYAFGARPHSDPTTITLLLQDHVGGLEVRDKHGEWMQVKPIPHAFVINLGDQLEVRVNNHHEL
jgi:isopenicillin N synthase-like dioxygenase